MKKLLLFAVVLLSGCARDITVYQHYDIDTPASKARLYIGKPPNAVERLHQAFLDNPAVQKSWRKYFLPSNEQTADFILTYRGKIDPDNDMNLPSFLNGFTLGIIPTWGTYTNIYSFSLTQRETGRTIDLSDIKEKVRLYTGWLLLPMAFSSKTSVGEDSPGAAAVLGNAIEEAASLVYDTNSRLYQQTPRWTPPAPAKQVPTINAAPVSAPASH